MGPSAIGEDKSGTVILYPNPGKGLFYLNTGEHEVELIQVFDATGSLVQEFAPKPGNQIIELDLSDQLSGLYFIKAKTGDLFMVRQLILTR